MKLTELFEQMPKITIEGKEYEVKFGVRSRRQLLADYDNDENKLSLVIQRFFDRAPVEDLINLLYAGLLHCKEFKSKEEVIDAIDYFTAEELAVCADSIIGAWLKCSVTKEQLDKIEVLNAQSDAKKKNEITEQNTHSLGQK